MTTTPNGYASLRSLLKAFNLAKRAKVFTSARLNRGLGIAMRSNTARVQRGDTYIYETPGTDVRHQFTTRRCDCADRGAEYCKHKIGAMLLEKAASLESTKGG